MLVAMFSKGLPKAYDTFATVVTHREKQMTFVEFKSALRSHQERAKDHSAKTDHAGDNAMLTKSTFDGNCFKCGRHGHKSSGYLSKMDKWCSNCKSKSHYTKSCRKKKDTAKTATEKTASPEDNENNKHSFAFVSKDTNKSGIFNKNPNLLLDSGATSNIINDEKKFVDFDKEFNACDHVLELPDGSKASVVRGKEKAKVRLYDVNGKAREVMLDNALYVP